MDKNTVKSNINVFGGHLRLMKDKANKYQALVEKFMNFLEGHKSAMEEAASLNKSEYTCYLDWNPTMEEVELIEKIRNEFFIYSLKMDYKKIIVPAQKYGFEVTFSWLN